jgi:hypothetical protein
VAYFEQSRLVEGSAVPRDMEASQPAVELSRSRLLLQAAPGQPPVEASARIKNVGTTALAYTWRPRRTGAAGVARLEGTGAADDGIARFFSKSMSGHLLPGEEAVVTVSFASPTAGTFAERWELETVPPLLLPPAASTGHAEVAATVSPSLELRAICAEPNLARAQRAALHGRLARSEVASFVQDLLYKEVVKRAAEIGSKVVRPPALVPPRDGAIGSERAALVARFEAANASAGLCFEPRVFGRLARIAAQASRGSANAAGSDRASDADPTSVGGLSSSAAAAASVEAGWVLGVEAGWDLSVQSLETMVATIAVRAQGRRTARALTVLPGEHSANARTSQLTHAPCQGCFVSCSDVPPLCP